MRKISGLLLSLLAFISILFVTGCGKKAPHSETVIKPEQQQIIIGYAQIGSESAWRNANSESVKDAAEKAGFSLIFKSADGNQEKQIKILKGFIMQQVDAIIFAPIVKDGWDEVLQEAKDAGIPVILCDREINTKNSDFYVSYIGNDSIAQGVKAAKWLIKTTENTKKTLNIVELEGTIGSAPQIDRKNGFGKTISKFKRFKIIDSKSGDFIRAKGKDVMSNILKKHGKKIDVVFTHNDEMALGAVEAIEEYGLEPGKDILIVSIDGQKEALQAIVDGKINASAECTPLFGPTLMKAVKDIKAGKKLPKKIVPKETIFTIENAAEELPKRSY